MLRTNYTGTDMADKKCTTCRWAAFEKTKSGRRNLEEGECCVNINLPHSFINMPHSFISMRFMPKKQRISKHTKPNCPLHEKAK